MTAGRALDIAEAPQMFDTETIREASDRLIAANQANEYGTAWSEYFGYKLARLAPYLL